MSSFEELMRIAEENSRLQHKKIAEKKRLREREEALRLKEKERVLEQQNRHKKQLTQFSVKERVLPQPIPRRPVPNSNNSNTRPSTNSERPSGSGANPLRKRGSERESGFPTELKTPKPLPRRSEVGGSNTEARPVKSTKSAALLSFDELKKMATSSANPSKPPAPLPQPTVKKNPPPAPPNRPPPPRRPQPLEPLPTARVPPNGQAYPRSNPPPPPLKKRPVPSNSTVAQPSTLRRPPSPPRAIKRPNPEPPTKRPTTTLTLGTRFSKYGPLDDDLPAPRSNNPTGNSNSRPPIQRVQSGNPNRPTNPPNNSRPNPNAQRPIPLSKSSSVPNYKPPQPVKRMVQPEPRDRPRPLDPRRPPMAKPNPNRPPASMGQARPPPSRVPSQRPSEPAKRRRPGPNNDIIDEEYAKNNISSIIGSIFGYDRSKYRDDFSDDDMEVSASRVRAEELRSARLGREEDELEEALEQERLARLRQRKRQR